MIPMSFDVMKIFKTQVLRSKSLSSRNSITVEQQDIGKPTA